MSTATFKESIHSAVHNANLTGALGRFSEAYRIGRAKAYEGIDFEEVRGRIAEVKGYAAKHLDELAEIFQKNAEARGAKVFRTSDPNAVNRYIQNLARENGVKSVVKSKSMASEEIHLNKHLAEAGIEVSETDLGEWIVQLAGERPSHMVIAGHPLTKEQVADIFSKEVNERLAADIPALVKLARKELRTKFLNAEMGISGANIAVAETGSIVIITNEGNARSLRTLPQIACRDRGRGETGRQVRRHPADPHALPRSATGQLLTSYVIGDYGSVAQLRRQPEESAHRADGQPPHRHVGRSGVPEALQCIRCASCLNVCPVFRLVGGHVFGKTYTGGIGHHPDGVVRRTEEVRGDTGAVHPVRQLHRGVPRQGADPRHGSRNCAVESPKSRDRRSRRKRLSRSSTVADCSMECCGRHRRCRSPSRKTDSSGIFRCSVGPVRVPQFAGSCGRSVPGSIREDRAGRSRAKRPPSTPGVSSTSPYPETGEAVVKLLNKAGSRGGIPEGQTCCGAPARFSGAYETAAGNAVANIDALLADDVRYVVSACPTCHGRAEARLRPRPSPASA
ncbi:MAG: LUD domain-containing protein [Ignavibacteriota bacterium]